MFRDEAQQDRACRLLLTHGFPRALRLWNGKPGPGDLLNTPLTGISTYERVMVNTAIQVWTGGSSWANENYPVALSDFLGGMGERQLLVIATLLSALAGQAADIDAWIARWEVSRG